ncbi:MAG TPA: hypothetical protein VFC06_00460 [Demequina sp.]|nr:hypothetical protein [Demequina sp.]
MSADDTTLTPESRRMVVYYRKRAEECRTNAVTWDALADELEAFGETGEHDDGQGALL